MGVPVIVSNQCGAAELISPGLNGWVCDPDSVAPLALLMAEAAGAAGSKMGGVARRTAEGFSVDKMADQMINLYGMLLGRPRGERIGN